MRQTYLVKQWPESFDEGRITRAMDAVKKSGERLLNVFRFSGHSGEHYAEIVSDDGIDACPVCLITLMRIRAAVHLISTHGWPYAKAHAWLQEREEQTGC